MLKLQGGDSIPLLLAVAVEDDLSCSREGESELGVLSLKSKSLTDFQLFIVQKQIWEAISSGRV